MYTYIWKKPFVVQQNQHTYTISRLFQVRAQFRIIIDRFLFYPHIKNSPKARRSFVQTTRLARRRAHHWGRWSRQSSAQAPMRTPPRRAASYTHYRTSSFFSSTSLKITKITCLRFHSVWESVHYITTWLYLGDSSNVWEGRSVTSNSHLVSNSESVDKRWYYFM